MRRLSFTITGIRRSRLDDRRRRSFIVLLLMFGCLSIATRPPPPAVASTPAPVPAPVQAPAAGPVAPPVQNPAAALVVTPGLLEFGTDVAGGGATRQVAWARSDRDSTIGIATVRVTPQSVVPHYTLDDECSGAKVTREVRCKVTVRFRPKSVGDHAATLEFLDESGVVLATAQIRALAISAASMGVQPMTIEFQEFAPVPQQVTVSSLGDYPLRAIRARIRNNPAAFTLDAHCPQELAKGRSCGISVNTFGTGAAPADSDELLVEYGPKPEGASVRIVIRPAAAALLRPVRVRIVGAPGRKYSQAFTLFNAGNTPTQLHVAEVSDVTKKLVVNMTGCAAPLAAGASCQAQLDAALLQAVNGVTRLPVLDRHNREVGYIEVDIRAD